MFSTFKLPGIDVITWYRIALVMHLKLTGYIVEKATMSSRQRLSTAEIIRLHKLT